MWENIAQPGRRRVTHLRVKRFISSCVQNLCFYLGSRGLQSGTPPPPRVHFWHIYIYIHTHTHTHAPYHLHHHVSKVFRFILNLHQRDTYIRENICISIHIYIYGGTRWRSWLRHCATSRKVAGSIPDGVIGFFH